ncbi:hypothetical protein DMUE_1896 [Dictyocoela muelleri]|nr:hypothetical protein DMUE_1896 [Dictyocoela muelleri]
MEDLYILLIHPGRKKLFNTITNYVKIKNLKKIINSVCKRCTKCQEEKSYTKAKVLTKFVTEPYNRSEIIAVDIKGPIKTIHFDTEKIKNKTYIVVITDLFSRYTKIPFVNDIHSSTICDAIEKTWLKFYPTPSKSLTDNGRQFTSENFAQIMKKFKIKYIRTPPHNPTRNSIV